MTIVPAPAFASVQSRVASPRARQRLRWSSLVLADPINCHLCGHTFTYEGQQSITGAAGLQRRIPHLLTRLPKQRNVPLQLEASPVGPHQRFQVAPYLMTCINCAGHCRQLTIFATCAPPPAGCCAHRTTAAGGTRQPTGSRWFRNLAR